MHGFFFPFKIKDETSKKFQSSRQTAFCLLNLEAKMSSLLPPEHFTCLGKILAADKNKGGCGELTGQSDKKKMRGE